MGCPLGPRPGPRARALPGPGLMLQGSAAQPAVASAALGGTGLEPGSALAAVTGPGALAFRLSLDLGDATASCAWDGLGWMTWRAWVQWQWTGLPASVRSRG